MSRKIWNPYYLAVYHAAKTFTTIFGSLEVVGDENIPAGRCVIASNHVSHLDPPLIGSCVPREIHFLARKTLFDNPLIGHVISRTNAIPVDLEKSFDLASFKKLISLASSGESVLIFPEGTRSPDGDLGEAKDGAGMLACKMAMTVVPTRIFGAFSLLPRGARFPSSDTRVSIVFGKPIQPSEYDPGKNDPERYAKATHRIMSAIAALKEPVHSVG